MRSKRLSESVELMQEIKWLANRHPAEVNATCLLGTYCEAAPGRTLTAQRAPAREAFLVLGGTGRVAIDGRLVARVGPGDFVGEMGVLDRQPRSATVVAETPMRLLVFDPRSFPTFLERPAVGRALATCLAGRLRAADEALMAHSG